MNESLELALYASNHIVAKVQQSDAYAQALYAGLCNNEFVCNDHTWSCSWRYAGGVVATMQARGDYLNWYCSGFAGENAVPEGTVTEEIANDLLELGWTVKQSEE